MIRKMIQRHDDSPGETMLREPIESATTWLVFGKTARTGGSRSGIPIDPDQGFQLIAITCSGRSRSGCGQCG
jgi:hypothetical protein